MRLLIVDNSVTFRRRIRLALQRIGFGTATELQSAEQLVSALSHENVCLVITSYGRRADEILELVSHIRTHLALQTVLAMMVSPRGTPEDVMRALDMGADYYLVDPFTDAYLEQKVRAAIERVGADSGAIQDEYPSSAEG